MRSDQHLRSATSDVTIRGLVIHRVPGTAIMVGASGPEVLHTVIEGNYIGTDISGAV